MQHMRIKLLIYSKSVSNYSKKNWLGQITCQLCNQNKSIGHLFVQCTFTKYVWFWMESCHEEFTYWDYCSNKLTLFYNFEDYELIFGLVTKTQSLMWELMNSKSNEKKSFVAIIGVWNLKVWFLCFFQKK